MDTKKLAGSLGSSPLLLFLAILIFGALSWIALTAFEFIVLDLYPVREEPPDFTPYFLLRSTFALVISVTLVGVLYRYSDRDSLLKTKSLSAGQQRFGALIMFAALAGTALFLVSPEAFRDLAREDNPIEWIAALLLLIASACFVREAVQCLRQLRRGDWLSRVELAVTSGLAILLFLIAMEEISWMQRIVGFETPAEVEQMNWQGEFNLHNIHTDLSETVFYTGTGIFLFLMPLLRETLRVAPAVGRLLAFAPSRSVAAASAPSAMFTYGHWNLIPIQITVFIALLAMLAFSGAARRRGDVGECRLFLILAIGIAIGQAVFLTYGANMLEIPNATEFKELFIAIGLAWYAFDRFMTGPAVVHQEQLSEQDRRRDSPSL